MTDSSLGVIYSNYLAAFAADSKEEQERLLRESVTENLIFSNPGVEASGLLTLLAHIGNFRKKFPGGRFQMNWIRQQHGHFLAEWTQLNSAHQALVTGHSYGRINSNARIDYLAGFWQSGAV